jgi:tricorn protease
MLQIRPFFAALLLLLLAAPTFAQEPIRLARTPDISPDGKLVAFSYLGDIYTVETIGGVAKPVTSHPAHDINPVFSPDGRHIAFSSNRHGSYDVYVVPVRGGRPTRLTFDSANEIVCDWTPDGKHILFSSARNVDFPRSWELYTVPVTGGRVRKITTGDGKEGTYSPRGDRLAYVRGPGSWYRKGYRGSSNDDIWVCNADGTSNQRLTTFEGQDSSPMWSADGTSLYYVSEFHGVGNIVAQPLTALLSPSTRPRVPAKPAQLTQHKQDGVRQARISRDGKWIVYECGADLWVVGTAPGCKPRKLAIEVYADDKSNPERVLTFSSGATEYAVSADEKFVAFALHGKLFRMPIGTNPKVTQMTFGPSEPGKAWGNDHGMAWAPDGLKMIFVSDRNGHEDLYLLEADDPDHPRFTEANRFKVTQLTRTRKAVGGVSFSPDGKRVGFIRAGKLWTMAPDGKDQKVVVDQVQVFDYEWSPDSRWIAYARRDGNFANELYIVPADGPTAANPIRNITRYATFNAGVTWSADGKKLCFLSDRRGRGGNLFVLDLEKPAAPGSTPPERPSFMSTWAWGSKAALTIDWEDIHRRAKPIGTVIADDAAISPDGSKVAFRDALGGDLWVASTTGGQITRLTTGKLFPKQISWSKRRSPLGGSLDFVYFLDRNGNVRLGRAAGSEAKAGSSNNNTAPIPFKVKMTMKRDELYREMFDQGWRHLAESFYDDKFHGANWDAVRDKYRPLIGHVSMKEDLFALLYLMMGELNASHLGVSGFFQGPEESTAELGLVFDESYRGKGLKIGEVLKRGPADRRGVKLKAGEIVLAIDGTTIDDSVNVSKLLNGKAGEAVVLQVTSNPADIKAKRRVEIHATDRATVANLMYDRWVAKNAARVSELSKGKLGYIHIPSMDEAGLDGFVRSLYSDNYDKEAIVLDVRFNGGGNTHDQVLNYLGSKEHTIFKTRGGGQGAVLRSWDRKWNKPLVLLINNRSYSDAEILPSAFRTLSLGKLVGEPTGGNVIGTSGVRLIDGSLFRIPRIGVYTARGVNMEKEGVKPDVLIENHPDQVARGLDKQLDRAVEVLQADVITWKKKNGSEVAKRPEVPGAPGRAPTPVPMPMGGPR